MQEKTRLTRKEKIAQNLEKPEGNRKRRAAEARKEARKNVVQAVLRDDRNATRKMRLVADLVRGQEASHAVNLLGLATQAAAKPMRKLLLSALNNWKQKFPDDNLDEGKVFVHTVTVDGGPMLKRIRPAPQGRAHRIRKRSNHVRIVLAEITEQKDGE